jgi:signal transduction histidine kinase
MGKKFFSPRVLHKSLLLVLIPLIIQTIFVFQLSGVVSKAEQMALAERKQSTVVEHVNWLMAQFAATISGYSTYVLTGHRPYAIEGKNALIELRAQFNELESLLVDSPKQLSQVRKLRAMSENEFQQIEALEPAEERNSITYLWTHIKEFRESMQETGLRIRLLIGMMAAEKQELEAVRKDELKARQNVKEQIFSGLMVNFVLVGILLAWFINNITGRLSVLVENARKLPTGQPLEKHVKGSDELAYLDEAMHKAALDLKAANEHRQALMEMVAHDLRSPLMSCQVSMQILDSDKMPDLPPIAKKQITAVQSNIARVVDMVNDLLTMDKLEAGKLELALEEFDVKELAEEARESVAALARAKNISLSNDCMKEKVNGDRKRLMQVLINFLSNAIKFSPPDSSIKIFSGHEEDQLVISVEDQGPGLSQEEQKHLFDKFYQASSQESSKGFGLGLAICRMLVEAHGGKVGVESTAGQGSRFWLSLPG